MTYLAVLIGKKWRLTGKSESQVDHKRCCSNGQSVGNSTPPGTVLVGKVAIDRKILWITGRPQTMLQCRSKRWELHAAWNLDTVSAVDRNKAIRGTVEFLFDECSAGRTANLDPILTKRWNFCAAKAGIFHRHSQFQPPSHRCILQVLVPLADRWHLPCRQKPPLFRIYTMSQGVPISGEKDPLILLS